MFGLSQNLFGYCSVYWFRSILKSPAWYVSVKALLEQSNPEIVWMSGSEYFELLKCYLEEQ
jgi:hypothetical protein